MIVCFFICWLPYHLLRIVYVSLSLTNSWTVSIKSAYLYIHNFVGVLYYGNSMLNPFLYSLCSRRFQQRLKEVLTEIKSMINRLISIRRKPGHTEEMEMKSMGKAKDCHISINHLSLSCENLGHTSFEYHSSFM